MHLNRDGFWYRVACESQLFPDLVVDRLEHLGVVLEELLDVLAALAETLAVVGKPGAALLDDPLVDCEVEEVAGSRDAFSVHDVELGLAEGWGHLVLDDLHARSSSDDRVAVLDARDAPDVHSHRRIEL